MRFKELLQTAERIATPTDIKGRRRPGRNDQVSPHLIPLLRDPTTIGVPAPLPCEEAVPLLVDDTVPARGIVFGLALSIPVWVWVAAVAWAVLR